ncbi:hypothetical protein ACF0H5_005086 [Mactra antiquata]
MDTLVYLLLSISCCLVASTISVLASPLSSQPDGAAGLRPEVKKSKLNLGIILQDKNFPANFCDLNCTENKDLDLELCETKCDADYPHDLDKQTQCQEKCASNYLQCLEKCGSYSVMKK